jgi:hypothetical protein
MEIPRRSFAKPILLATVLTGGLAGAGYYATRPAMPESKVSPSLGPTHAEVPSADKVVVKAKTPKRTAMAKARRSAALAKKYRRMAMRQERIAARQFARVAAREQRIAAKYARLAKKRKEVAQRNERKAKEHKKLAAQLRTG